MLSQMNVFPFERKLFFKCISHEGALRSRRVSPPASAATVFLHTQAGTARVHHSFLLYFKSIPKFSAFMISFATWPANRITFNNYLHIQKSVHLWISILDKLIHLMQ